jgi:hypothetical protein
VQRLDHGAAVPQLEVHGGCSSTKHRHAHRRTIHLKIPSTAASTLESDEDAKPLLNLPGYKLDMEEQEMRYISAAGFPCSGTWR